MRETLGANQRALKIASNLYRNGLITYINVLTVQIQTVQAEQQLANALLAQSTHFVKLYKALGGGWQQKSDEHAAN